MLSNQKLNIMELKNLFEKEHEKAQASTSKYEQELTERWHEYLKGAKLIMEKLEFLPARFKVAIKGTDFSIENCRNSSYPKVLLFVGGSLTNVEKYGTEGDSIGVSGLGLFPLMGESHTFESFIKKIAKY